MIDWAIVPTAGRGSRMYPAAAVVPKALLPVGVAPMLHWALDEAARAGIGGVAVVVGPEQGLIRDYVEAARSAHRHGGHDGLARLGAALSTMEVRWIEQREPAGIGDAFIRCRDLTGDRPFAVLLPDNWFLAERPAIGQVITTFERTGLCTFGLTAVPAGEETLFGNVGGVELEPLGGDSYRVVRLQDKRPGTFDPAAWRGDGGEVLRGCARYAVTAEFYDALSETGPPPVGEWDDVPAFQRLLRSPGLAGHRIEGRHYDVGLPAGYLAAAAWLRAAGIDQP